MGSLSIKIQYTALTKSRKGMSGMFDYNIFVLKKDDALLESLYQWMEEIEVEVNFKVYLANDDDERSYRKDTNLFNHFNLIILNNPLEIQEVTARMYKLISDSIFKNKAAQLDNRIFMDHRIEQFVGNINQDVEFLSDDIFYTLNDTMQSFHVLASAKAVAVWQENQAAEETLDRYNEVSLVYTHSDSMAGHTYSEDLLNYEEEEHNYTPPYTSEQGSRLDAVLGTKVNNMGFSYEEDGAELNTPDEESSAPENYENETALEQESNESPFNQNEEMLTYGDNGQEEELPFETEEDIQTDYDKDGHIVKRSVPHNEQDSVSKNVVAKQKEEPTVPLEKDITPIQNDKDMEILQNARRVQKQLFGQQSWNEHKTIGVWSPVHKMGVTTFIMNYATFLAENRVYVGILEALRTDPALKDWLQRYSPMPETWSSYAQTIHSNQSNAELVRWDYKNVLYLPLDRSDISLNWDAELLAIYLNLPSLMDVTFVDMPTGEMNASSLKTLDYLTELWVLVDDNHFEILSWYNYIHQLKKKHNIEIKLIFNKAFPFSPYKDLCKTLELPLLAVIPSLHEEMARNNYQNGPVISVAEVRQHLYEPFKDITKYLMGDDFVLHAQKNAEVIVPSMQASLSNKHWSVFFDKLKRLLKALRSA